MQVLSVPQDFPVLIVNNSGLLRIDIRRCIVPDSFSCLLCFEEHRAHLFLLNPPFEPGRCLCVYAIDPTIDLRELT